MAKKYRINESEYFNLHSMYNRLKCIEIDMIEGKKEWSDEVIDRIEEIENLMDKAPYVGALMTWEDLKRIREIKAERQFIRYNIAKENGATEKEANYAFI